MCGGTEGRHGQRHRGAGLSPRVRGNHSTSTRRPSDSGSIPACAGEPRRYAVAAASQEVYPRVCGGTHFRRFPSMQTLGLSPRVRGNRASRLQVAQIAGSIPACAGEPESEKKGRSRARVYPRVCGGTECRSSRRASTTGLSPRVRGNRPPGAEPPSTSGSIPACAGEPEGNLAAATAVRVYPRVCGGTSLHADYQTQRQGLSPRVRGNPWRWFSHRPDVGSIPACAGEPLGGCHPLRA